jgi:hypothetical protein
LFIFKTKSTQQAPSMLQQTFRLVARTSTPTKSHISDITAARGATPTKHAARGATPTKHDARGATPTKQGVHLFSTPALFNTPPPFKQRASPPPTAWKKHESEMVSVNSLSLKAIIGNQRAVANHSAIAVHYPKNMRIRASPAASAGRKQLKGHI